MAKKAIMAFYLSLALGVQYTRDDIHSLVESWLKKGIKIQKDFTKYYNKFLIRTRYLEKLGLITTDKSVWLFVKVFLELLKDQLK